MDSWNNKNYWNQLAVEIKEDGQLGRALPDDAPEPIVRWVAELEKDISKYCLSDHSGLLLDAGCGNANFRMHASNQHSRGEMTYVGMDFSEKMLERRAAQKTSNQDASFVQGSISAIPFRANMFDRIVCNGVITCLGSSEEIEDTLKDFYRILKPEGVLIFDIFNKFLPKTILKSILQDKMFPKSPKYNSPFWIIQRLKMAGFDSFSYRGYDFKPTAGYLTYRGALKILNPGFIQERISNYIEKKIVARVRFLNLLGSRIYIKCKTKK